MNDEERNKLQNSQDADSVTQAEAIGKRLKEWSPYTNQTIFAKAMGTTQSTVSRWCRGIGIGVLVGIDRLVQTHGTSILEKLFQRQSEFTREITDESGESLGQLRWEVRIPEYLTEEQAIHCNEGAKFFVNIVKEGLSVAQATKASIFADKPKATAHLYFSLQIALASGVLKITQVPRHEKYEQELLKWSKGRLKDVRVAVVPRNSDKDYHSCTTIRTEYVSWLTSYSVLPHIKSGLVGVGGGYTIRRMAELSVSSVGLFKGTTWIPLVTYHDKVDGSVNKDTDANYTTHLLVSKHPESQSLFYNFNSIDTNPSVDAEIMKAHAELDTGFVSVNGDGRKTDGKKAGEYGQYRNANYMGDSPLIRLFNSVPEEQVAGEFLGQLLDDKGKIVTYKDVNKDIREFVEQIELGRIIERVRDNDTRMWLLAAREYKIRPTLMAIRHGLVNCLVVDEEIAEKLLEIDIESADTYKI